MVSGSSIFTPARLPRFPRFSLHYNYTHRRTGFSAKSFQAANVGITKAVILDAKGETIAALFRLLVAVALEKILPAIRKDRTQRIIHPNVKVKAFQQEKQVMVSAC